MQKPRQDEPFALTYGAIVSAQSSSEHERSQRQDDAYQVEMYLHIDLLECFTFIVYYIENDKRRLLILQI